MKQIHLSFFQATCIIFQTHAIYFHNQGNTVNVEITLTRYNWSSCEKVTLQKTKSEI